MFDVLITGGKIIDGSGGESFSSDVGIMEMSFLKLVI